MDSGVRRLCVDIAGVSDVGAISYEILRREFTFECVAVHYDLSVGSLYPTGSLLVCSSGSLRELVEQFPFLTVNNLKAIAEFHAVVLSSELWRAMCVDALRIHECGTTCPSLLRLFR
ncbi:hypothetical protein M404DRAFT_21440 [Pisolithus tinctorius Marx 270]|uniref:Uncharacterized protein n=1 Tax=Pisolithus tinctorius Marx 270 TaxID=870435 RepID=A0A0C3PPU8_PISTI|nr:hypothetical protein M404DRAFT_21440 [Pisolithus tinctorius Marx 270]